MMGFQNQDSGGTSTAVKNEPNKYESSNIVETRMLYLSTKSSQCTLLNGDMKSRVSFDIKSYLDFQDDDTIQSITLAMPYAIIVNSNYQINSNNNRLDIIYQAVTYSYSFPYGNYDADTFMQTFISLLPTTFRITYSTTSLKFSVSNTLYPFTLLGTSTIDYIMGFSDDIVVSTAPYSVTMPRLMNFLPNPLFRICIENNTLYNGQVLGKAGTPQYSNVLASIPNVTKTNTQIVYQNFADEFTIQKSNQTVLILSIVDDEGNLVDFNGIASYFQLRLRIYRRIQKRMTNFYELLTNSTKLRDELENDENIIQKPIEKIL